MSVFSLNLMVLSLCMYILSIIIPGVILWIELKRGLDFPEMFQIALAKLYMHYGKNDEAILVGNIKNSCKSKRTRCLYAL